MGCNPSTQKGGAEAQAPAERKGGRPKKDKHAKAAAPAKPSPGNHDPTPEKEETVTLTGKKKYIDDVGAIVMEVEDTKKNVQAVLTVFGESGITFAVRDVRTSAVYVREFTDQQFVHEKQQSGISCTWGAFFKSIASDITKAKAQVAMHQGHVTVTVGIQAKDAKTSQPFSIRLEQRSADPKEVFKLFLRPMTKMVQRKRATTDEKEKELRYAKLECETLVKEFKVEKCKATVQQMLPKMKPLRDDSAAAREAAQDLANKIQTLERKVRRHKQGHGGKPDLDRIYDDGGAQPFQHIPQSEEHQPKEIAPVEALSQWCKQVFPLAEGVELATITRTPSDPALVSLLNQAPGNVAKQAMEVMTSLDAWNLDIFELDRLTNGCALFHVTYALMYKLNLVTHFNLDDAVLRNFLTAVQAGYHPNPYHNALHAADVTQVNAFIMTKGGLQQTCQLQPEDLLAGLLSGAIHDYDHPGFNNNFHTRTWAYLSTLYNDRSILENHHLACIFEIMRLPKFNLFAPLEEERRKDVRDTMIEMVLSTDMGNHAKIFSQFRRRLSEGSVWSERKEDVRMALSMSIKMADISNCGRPNGLYTQWAKRVSDEFYNQGDVESQLKLTISPFMDRRKEKTDFPKGQISFMNYIVIPMFEAIAEFLPNVEFVLNHCQENKEYWTYHSE